MKSETGYRADVEIPHTGNVLKRLRVWWDRQEMARQVLGLDLLERRRMAWDLGVAPVGLGQLVASSPSGETLLPAMMRRFGVEEARLGPRHSGVLQDMRRVCAMCPSKRRCRHALAAGASAQGCRGFCRNVETLSSLAGETRCRERNPAN